MINNTFTSSDKRILYQKEETVGVGTFSVVTKARIREFKGKEVDLDERC